MTLDKVPSLIDNKLYQHFSSENFYVKAGLSYDNLSLTDQILKISDAIESLNLEINDLVSKNYQYFIEHTKKVNDLDLKFETLQTNVTNLLSVLEGLKSVLSEPYKEISQRINLLNRLQTTCDLLRRIIRIFALGKKLEAKELNSNSDTTNDISKFNYKDLLQKALCLNEVNQLLEEDELLNKVEIIKSHLDNFKKEQKNIEQTSLKMMDLSLSKQDITLLTYCLQIFFLFNNLENVIECYLNDKQKLIIQTMQTTFNSKANQIKIWIKLESLADELAISFEQVYFLNRVLTKRRDALNQNYLIESLQNNFDPDVFVQNIFDNLDSNLKISMNDSQTIKKMIEHEYPKFLETFNKINFKLSNDIDKSLKQFFRPYETAYLSCCLSTLFDLVNEIFVSTQYNSDQHLNTKNIDNLIKEIKKQLVSININEDLEKLICKNICQSINLFLAKTEQLVKVGADATQIIDYASDSQKLNSKIVHRINYFYLQLTFILPESNLDNHGSVKTIKKKLSDCKVLIYNIVSPFFNSIKEAIEDILLTMHHEKYSQNNNDSKCSLYMKELNGFLLRIKNDYLNLLPNNDVIRRCCISLSKRCIDLFLKLATTLRHQKVLNVIKRKLIVDCEKLEQALFLLGNKVSDLGKNYRAFRAFKSLLNQELDSIAKSPVIGNVIPYSIVIQYLISAFTIEIQLPHELMNWSIVRYIKWCDDNEDEKVRLNMLKQCLENYVKQFGHQQNLKTFPPIYCIIVKLLETADSIKN